MGHYKGRTSIEEITNMSNRMFHGLYVRLLKKLSTDDGQKEQANEQIQEAMEEVGM